MNTQTKSAFMKYWASRLNVIGAVMNGLDGKPFRWESDGARDSYMRLLRGLGINLVTQTWLDKRGYKLNRGAKPVGRVKYASPINSMVDVYVLECQAYLVDPAKLAKVEAAAAERRAKRESDGRVGGGGA